MLKKSEVTETGKPCFKTRSPRPQNMFVVFLLTIITLGIYWAVYMFRFARDVENTFDLDQYGSTPHSVRLSILWGYIIAFAWMIELVCFIAILTSQYPGYASIMINNIKIAVALPNKLVFWTLTMRILNIAGFCVLWIPVLRLLHRCKSALHMTSVDIGKGCVIISVVAQIADPVTEYVWLMNHRRIRNVLLSGQSNLNSLSNIQSVFGIVAIVCTIILFIVVVKSINDLWIFITSNGTAQD